MMKHALLLVAAALFFVSTACGPKGRPPREYHVPSEYRGWISVKYNVAGAPPLTKVGGKWIIKLSKTGTAETSTPPEYGPIVDDKVFLIFADGRRQIARFVGLPHPPHKQVIHCCRKRQFDKATKVTTDSIWVGKDGDGWKNSPLDRK